MLENVTVIFENRNQMLRRLKKSGYIEYMKQFRNEHAHFFEEMVSYTQEAQNTESAAKEVANDFTGKIQEHFSGRFGKIPGKTQAELNLFMVFYVFPAILLTENPCAKDICDALCASWAEFFPKNKILGYATYEELLPKFRDKIFGIF